MEQGEKKTFVIYYSRKSISLNKEANAQRRKIEQVLKGTPFEKYITTIFRHLLIVQEMQHGDGAEIGAAIRNLNMDLEIINTLLILLKATNLQIKCRYDKRTEAKAQCSNIPKELKQPFTQAALQLYNNNLHLCMIPTGETWENEGTKEIYNKTKYQPPTIEYLEKKQKELNAELEKWGIKKQAKGHPTYDNNTPRTPSTAFRIECAISVFIKCNSAFDERRWKTIKERNSIIFKCLEIMGIAPKGEKEKNINKLIGIAMKLDITTQYMYKDRTKEDETSRNIPFIAIIKAL